MAGDTGVENLVDHERAVVKGMEELVIYVFAHVARTARLADPLHVDVEVERPGIRFDAVGVEGVVEELARALVEHYSGAAVPRALAGGCGRDRRGQEADERQSAEDDAKTSSHGLVPP